ncbi:MAG: ATP-binding cassette domain-containing protein, partial [Butyrivibrio sp.]|nr:ATP-binding cassette domain-containing protein [Butyrivibrio sp.]
MEIRIINLSKQYGKKKALDGFGCVLEKGMNILLGPNGAGKTTLMNGIADAIKVTSGEILYNGENIYGMGEKFRAKLGYLPQNLEFYDYFTGRDILEYFAKLKKLKKGSYDTDALLETVNLTEAADLKCGGYSGGMKRRLGIATAILGDPEVIILDEPTAGLDPKERHVLKDNLKRLAENKIIIMATHIISDAEDIGDKIVLVKSGKNIGEGTIQELCERTMRETGAEKVSL